MLPPKFEPVSSSAYSPPLIALCCSIASPAIVTFVGYCLIFLGIATDRAGSKIVNKRKLRKPDRKTGFCGKMENCNPSYSKGAESVVLQLGDTVPDFQQASSAGDISFYEWVGDSWAILFSHPADYTPVCTTELGEVARLKPEFDKRNVKVLALSVDGVESHLGWIQDINETQQTTVNYPILADGDRKVSDLYGMIHPNANNTLTVRSVFIIDPSKKLRLTLTYPASTGRNFPELLRVIDSLQLTDNYQVATPVNWQDGEDCVIVPSLKDPEVLKEKFPKGYNEVKPYLRLTPQPNK